MGFTLVEYTHCRRPWGRASALQPGFRPAGSLRLPLFGLLTFTAAFLHAETGYDAWLRYAPKSTQSMPAVLASTSDSVLIGNAKNELIRGVSGMTGKTLRIESGIPKENAIVLSTLDKLPPQWNLHADLAPDGYWLKTLTSNGARYTVIAAPNDRGVLYGAFAFLRKISLGESIAELDERHAPATPVRWVNQWDNLDGSIERGYGGRSIFWENGKARQDLSRVADYGRLLASVGINGCSINNVNADLRILTPEKIADAARIADALRPWGVQVLISVDFGSPESIGGLDTFDPVDPTVAAWWRAKADEVYRAIPDLAGFIVKADSEGRVGPSTYGRTHADAANVIARALKPHGGRLAYRGFVYDHHMDWQNLKNDRARAAYDNFKPLDGQFDDNVIIQIKNGPIDFQVREPASPLFGALEKTNQAIELQITQEYMGQARHMVYLVPMWKETLDFDMRVHDRAAPVKRLITGFVGVANAGMDDNWFGNHLSQANLYGFGRLAWNPDLTSRQIADEWTRLAFGDIPAITAMQLSSWRTYENYTGPLGLQTLTDITGNHYGVNVEASERNGWGQWHRADKYGVGMDRTESTGTGYVGQYRPSVAHMYESLATCPDDLLLFMHHVPYTYKLHSGKTVIQYIYDSHYEGAAAVEGYVRLWESLKDRVDGQRYREILTQLEYQAGQAEVWRDAVSNWFLRESGIPDAKGRVGHYLGRFEAESMQLQGYRVIDVSPWEAASGGKAIECAADQCTATLRYNGAPGRYTIRVEYFDLNDGRFTFSAGGRTLDQWTASNHPPTRKIDGSSSTRRTIPAVAIHTGDEIRIAGGAIDYIELLPAN
jgi:alpha-glucuronidase